MKLAELVKKRRPDIKHRKDLAKEVGVHEQTFSRWVTGASAMSRKNAKELAKALGVSFHMIWNLND